ncbi:MAG: ribosome-associated translation inhibitor RaiA [Clostridiales bacterium]|nr:ribosome-associated translation inhibitor RaiA [Clostridiales bacterium]MDU5952539.1 ribosome-associated translation inhibitor RaiA [Clostridiales bacterium]
MRLTIKGRNVEVTDALRTYVEKRFSKLEKYFSKELEGTVTLLVEKGEQRAEATIPINRFILRAEESGMDMYASIDQVVDKIERQVRKYKTRLNRKAKQTEVNIGELLRQEEAEQKTADTAADLQNEQAEKISKVKQFHVRMMDPEEAIMQMELLDHDFFIFLNSESDAIDVVYRRKGGTYGLLQPLTK